MVSIAVTAWLKYDDWGETSTFKINVRARGFYYCYSKVNGAGRTESGEVEK